VARKLPQERSDLRRTSAELLWALRRLVEDHRLDAVTMNLLDLVRDGRCPTMPFLGLNNLMAEGLGYAGEGDRMTSAHMAQMLRLSGAANFAEVFTNDYAGNRILMMHVQECSPALARRDRRVRLVRKDFWTTGGEPYVAMIFTLEPGPVTLTAVVPDAGGGFTHLAYGTRSRASRRCPSSMCLTGWSSSTSRWAIS
jgi:L-arabinose isomerase